MAPTATHTPSLQWSGMTLGTELPVQSTQKIPGPPPSYFSLRFNRFENDGGSQTLSVGSTIGSREAMKEKRNKNLGMAPDWRRLCHRCVVHYLFTNFREVCSREVVDIVNEFTGSQHLIITNRVELLAKQDVVPNRHVVQTGHLRYVTNAAL